MKKFAVALFLMGAVSVGAQEIQVRLQNVVSKETAAELCTEGFIRKTVYKIGRASCRERV